MKKKRNSLYKINFSILLLFFIVSLLSCINPLITEKDLIRIEDVIVPELSLFTPPDNGNYAALIIIEGVVVDMATRNGIPGKVESLNCEVIGTNVHQNINIDRDGSFSHSFSSTGLDSTITLKVTAKDWNNNTTVVTRTLTKGAFPNFVVIPGNREVTLYWDPIAMTQSYTLYYTNDGSAPAELNPSTTILEPVQSPLYINELDNGFLYSFMLKANAAEGPDNYSQIETAIPLSVFTLAPRVTGEYNRIKVQWKDIPGADRYIVQRDTQKNGSFSVSSGQLNNTVYYDTNVASGQGYFYRVIPANQSFLPSEANYAHASPFPPPGTLAGSVDTPNHATDIALKGDYAYVADFDSGLQVISIANPGKPAIVGSVDTPGNARGICISGNYAYVADDGEGVQVIDITTPTAPEILINYTIPGSSCDVDIAGNYAYVAADDEGLFIIDITDPESPLLQGVYVTPESEAMSVKVEGNYAYIADGENGLLVINITDPENPDLHGSYNPVSFNFASDLAISGNKIYLADGTSGLQIINITNPAAPFLAGSFDTEGTSLATRVALYGDYAFVAYDMEGLHIINISDDATEPVLIGSYKITGRALGCATDGEFTYIAYDVNGMHVIHTATPAEMEPITSFTTCNGAIDVAIQGDYAFVADKSHGFYALNISNPETPYQTDSISFTDSTLIVESVELCGDYAFLTGYNIGLIVIDISDPSALEEIGWHIINYTTRSFIFGDFICLTYRDSVESGMEILIIADPFAPESIGNLTATNGYACNPIVLGNRAYIADGSAGITIVDISDVKEPSIIETCATPAAAVYVTSDGTYLYAATGTSGIQIIDPQESEIIGSYETNGAINIELQSSYAYVTNGYEGIMGIDITSPTDPHPAGLYDPNYNTKSITVSGRYAYVAADTNGFIILDLFPWD